MKMNQTKNDNIVDKLEFEMGEPYYCYECKRNHTKGKIYKEHLIFSKKFFLLSP